MPSYRPDPRPAEPQTNDLAAQIRVQHRVAGRRIAVLDDDPTGSQAVHGVEVVLTPTAADYPQAMATPGIPAFILTNTRSQVEEKAVALNRRVARDLYTWTTTSRRPLQVVSRSDSTLRGHVIAEVEAIAAEHHAALGRWPDGVLFCPAMLEAGRYTAGNIHYATVGGTPVPVGETEFAKDPSFGYTSSDLRDFIAEKSGGRIPAERVTSLSLDDIRDGGPERVAKLLGATNSMGWIVVNATEYGDLEVVSRGLQLAQGQGGSFLIRCGPSFVRSLAGIPAKPPLTAAEIPIDPSRSRYGLVVVGSHVGLSTRQLRHLTTQPGVNQVKLDVARLLDPGTAAEHLATVTAELERALQTADTVLYTSRELATPPAGSRTSPLEVAGLVSTSLVNTVGQVLSTRPAWIIAKGGITGHDLATRALGIRRARVLGQFLPGQISLFQPVQARPEAMGCAYVSFPGNVGDEETLSQVRQLLADRASPHAS